MRFHLSVVFLLSFLISPFYALQVTPEVGSSQLSKRVTLTEEHELYDIHDIEKRGPERQPRPLPRLPVDPVSPPPSLPPPPPRRLPQLPPPPPPPQVQPPPRRLPQLPPPPPPPQVRAPPRHLPQLPIGVMERPPVYQIPPPPRSPQLPQYGVMEGPSRIPQEDYHKWKSGGGR